MKAGWRPGDGLVIALVAMGIWGSTRVLWSNDQAERVIIRAEGRPFAELRLDHPQRVAVPGPLGITEIEVARGVVRVAKDPGPRQLCVHQGWLSRPGQIAICLPNRVSIEVQGLKQRYDSLGY